jgi:hypothetical protein
MFSRPALLWSCGDISAQVYETYVRRSSTMRWPSDAEGETPVNSFSEVARDFAARRADYPRIVAHLLFGALLCSPLERRLQRVLAAAYRQQSTQHLHRRLFMHCIFFVPLVCSLYVTFMTLAKEGITANAFVWIHFKALHEVPRMCALSWGLIVPFELVAIHWVDVPSEVQIMFSVLWVALLSLRNTSAEIL